MNINTSEHRATLIGTIFQNGCFPGLSVARHVRWPARVVPKQGMYLKFFGNALEITNIHSNYISHYKVKNMIIKKEQEILCIYF